MFEQRNSKQSWFVSTKAKKMKSHRCRAIGPRDCKQREREARTLLPFDFLRYWRTVQDSGPIKNGRKTMQRHNSQRDKAPNWRSATKMISHALRSFHGYFMPHSALFQCFSTFALRFFSLRLFLSFSLTTLASASWYKNMQMSRDEISTPVVPSFLLSLPLPLTSQLRLLVLASWPLFRRQEELHHPLDRPNLLHGPDVSIYKRGSRPLITVTL